MQEGFYGLTVQKPKSKHRTGYIENQIVNIAKADCKNKLQKLDDDNGNGGHRNKNPHFLTAFYQQRQKQCHGHQGNEIAKQIGYNVRKTVCVGKQGTHKFQYGGKGNEIDGVFHIQPE